MDWKSNLQSFALGVGIGVVNGVILYKLLSTKRKDTAQQQQQQQQALLPQLHISLADMITRAERLYSKKIATIDAITGEKKTYKEFCLNVKALATGLVKQLKLREGDRLGTLLLNSPEYMELYFACPWAGLMIVPQNTRLTASEIIYCLNDCNCSCLVVDETFYGMVDAIKKEVPSLKHVVYIQKEKKTDSNFVFYKDLIASWKDESQLIPASLKGNTDEYGIFYTGGTTGRSKGVVLHHTGLIYNAHCVALAVKYKQEGVNYLHVAPMFHLADGAHTFAVVMCGGSNTILPRFTPEGVFAAISERKVTHVLMVPTMYAMVTQAALGKATFDLSSLKMCVYGASPMPENILMDAMKLFSSAQFVQGYGLTETSPVVTFLPEEAHFKNSPLLSSAGQPVIHMQVKIVNEDGVEVGVNEVGEVLVRGPGVMKGYWNNAKATESAIRDGWFHTGDGGKVNEEGYLFIVDRIKDMIVSGGENVYSSEVESVLSLFPGVLASAVIGIPDEKLVEKVAAFVVVKNEAEFDSKKLIEFMKTKIASYKVPKEIFLRTEPLPMSGAGKILKSKLREPFWSEMKNKIYSNKDEAKTSYV